MVCTVAIQQMIKTGLNSSLKVLGRKQNYNFLFPLFCFLTFLKFSLEIKRYSLCQDKFVSKLFVILNPIWNKICGIWRDNFPDCCDIFQLPLRTWTLIVATVVARSGRQEKGPVQQQAYITQSASIKLHMSFASVLETCLELVGNLSIISQHSCGLFQQFRFYILWKENFQYPRKDFICLQLSIFVLLRQIDRM